MTAAAAELVCSCLSTQGSGSEDERRIVALLEDLRPRVLPFDRGHKLRSALRLLRILRRERPDAVVMEGTGIAGGIAVIAASSVLGVPYIVSSGDAVAPYLSLRSPALWPVADLYERLLCRNAAGFIGWSPYLVGRALTFGAPRGMTAPGWAPFGGASDQGPAIRERLGIPPDAVVFGLVGSLAWTERRRYCYGLELVRALRRVDRHDVVVLVVGDGDGMARLREEAGPELGRRVFLPGRVARDAVPAHLAAMDIASLPQSLDGVGNFRYTTKISEYRAAGLPIVTGQLPFAYDLDDGSIWRLPGRFPWGERYVEALATTMRSIDTNRLPRRHARSGDPTFDRATQQRAVSRFVRDCVTAERG